MARGRRIPVLWQADTVRGAVLANQGLVRWCDVRPGEPCVLERVCAGPVNQEPQTIARFRMSSAKLNARGGVVRSRVPVVEQGNPFVRLEEYRTGF